MSFQKESPAALAGAHRAKEVESKGALSGDDLTAGGNEQQAPRSPQAKWNDENPKALWAHNAVRSAMRRGLIERQACEVCGADETEAHHDDYERPLAVQWLCRLHHRRLHAERRREGHHA